MMSRISVIVPVYKVEKYLHRCIDSILNQTFTDFELIVVDDGSPDSCGEMLDEFLMDDRLVAIHKNNEGVSVARNIGVGLSSKEYVTFVDSDDWIDCKMFHQMYFAIQSTGAVMSICGYQYVDLDGNIVDNYVPSKSIQTNIRTLEIYAKEDNSIIHAPWGKLVSREVALANPFPRGRKYGEDFATVYKWIYDSKHIASIEFALYNYYFSETGISRNNIPWNDNLLTFDELISFCKEKKMKELQRLFIKERVDFDYYTYVQINDDEMKLVLRNDMKRYLAKYNFFISYYPTNKLEIYEVSFPYLMRIYCHTKAMLMMLKNKGLKSTICRLFKGAK